MEHSLCCMNNQMSKSRGARKRTKSNVWWVIAVPAIWDEMSKEMMKYCAKEAGMVYFSLGSEPVCTAFHVLQNCDIKLNSRGPTRFIVLDCGGGIVDAAYIQVSEDKHNIQQLHYSEGIRAGGLDIDDKFEEILQKLLSTEIYELMGNKAFWVKQRAEFMASKFLLSLPNQGFDNYTTTWNVNLAPVVVSKLRKWSKSKKKDKDKYEKLKALKKTIKEFEIEKYSLNNEDEKDNNDMVKAFELSQGHNQLQIKKDGWKWLHEEVLRKVVDFLRKSCNHAAVSSCNHIILSGGFAKSNYLRDRLQKEFSSKQFLIPSDPHLAVVKGICIDISDLA